MSTDGRAPALAGLIREGLETVLPEHDLREWLDTAERERQVWRQRGVPMKERRRLLLDALVKRYDEKKTDER